MSRYDFKLPDIGEGVTEGEVVGWHVKVGDTVKEDQPLADVMTDKATVTITCPKAGVVTATNGRPGEIIKVGAVLASFELGGGAPAATPAAPAKADGPAATAVGDIKESLPGMGAMVQTTVAKPAAPAVSAAPVVSAAPSVSAAPAYSAPGKVLATPATRKLARDLGVDLTRVPPSGHRGHVTKDDIRGFVARPSAPPAAVSAPPPVVTEAPAPQAVASAPAPAPMTSRAPVSIAAAPSRGGEVLEERVPFAGVRKRIAERMSLSKNTAAHFTFVEECDVTALKALRERMRPKAEARGVKLTYLPFIVKATVAALKRHPILNSALDESTNELVYRKYYNIGIAASSESGLVVPVVKGADRRSLLGLAQEIERLGGDVKAGKQKVDDLQGSTFTITSLGAQGGLFATPIINFPEVGILGVHQIKQKPVVRDGQIVIGEVMLLSLSFDHRIVDGHVGAAFAYEIINLLQDPDALLLDL
jgi:pyruvate dehydrogenase E2 component (dihydrolipoamide acetyltransferase)